MSKSTDRAALVDRLRLAGFVPNLSDNTQGDNAVVFNHPDGDRVICYWKSERGFVAEARKAMDSTAATKRMVRCAVDLLDGAAWEDDFAYVRALSGLIVDFCGLSIEHRQAVTDELRRRSR